MDEKKVESIIFGLKETIGEQKAEIERLAKVEIDLIGKIADKSAEIERLKDENEYLDMCGKQFLADYQKCEIERAELQNKVEVLNREINGFANKLQDAHEERENMQAEIFGLEEDKRQLQKQVDELKAENARLNKCVMSEEQVRKCCADIIQSTRQQAVKDTAKEIFDVLAERKERVKAFYGVAESVGVDIAINTIKEILKQKGV